MPGVGHGEGKRRSDGTVPKKSKKKTSQQIRDVWPDLREMILPRRWVLALGFVLMVINRLSGMVLPISTKYLIDAAGTVTVDIIFSEPIGPGTPGSS